MPTPGLVLPDHLLPKEEDEMAALSRQVSALAMAVKQIIEVLGNHKQVISEQNQLINLHGTKLLQVESILKTIRRRQKRAGYKVLEDEQGEAGRPEPDAGDTPQGWPQEEDGDNVDRGDNLPTDVEPDGRSDNSVDPGADGTAPQGATGHPSPPVIRNRRRRKATDQEAT